MRAPLLQQWWARTALYRPLGHCNNVCHQLPLGNSASFNLWGRLASSSSSSSSALFGSPSLPSWQSATSWGGHNELSNAVTTEWLEQHLDDEDLAIVDIRGQVVKDASVQQAEDGETFVPTRYEGMESDYLDSHIPNACFIDWTKNIAEDQYTKDPETGSKRLVAPAQLINRSEFITAMEERGIGADKKVVVYDNGNMLFATRFWWAMKVYGHEQVGVLDGGWAKWEAEGRPQSIEAKCPLKAYTDWKVDEKDEKPHLRCCIGDVLALVEVQQQQQQQQQQEQQQQQQQRSLEVEGDGDVVGNGGEGGSKQHDILRLKEVQIIDARGKDQYQGTVKRAARGGHIPGALSTPYKSFLNSCEVNLASPPSSSPPPPPSPSSSSSSSPQVKPQYKTFKSRNEMRTVLESAGCDVTKPTLAYCNGGVASTMVMFALYQLGNEQVTNYDGSWNEWGNRSDTPVEVDGS